ncbi:hypothetical protein [Streptomyces sp. NPDC001770]
MLTEREVRTAEATPGRAAELLADHGVPQVPLGAQSRPLLPVPAGPRAVHWPDLVLVLPGDGIGAIEVELTAKTPSALRRILRAYGQAPRRVGTSAPSRSSASCRAAPARAGGGPTASARTSDCSRPEGPTPESGS